MRSNGSLWNSGSFSAASVNSLTRTKIGTEEMPKYPAESSWFVSGRKNRRAIEFRKLFARERLECVRSPIDLALQKTGYLNRLAGLRTNGVKLRYRFVAAADDYGFAKFYLLDVAGEVRLGFLHVDFTICQLHHSAKDDLNPDQTSD